MIILKAFKFRLNPTKKQIGIFNNTLDQCRWLYNYSLEQRILAYEELGLQLSKFQQQCFLPPLKEATPGLLAVHSQVLQNVNDRLDKAFKGFFTRCKAGQTPGYPRFRSLDRYDSFCYPCTGFSIDGKELKLSKIGSIQIIQHRQIEGKVKTCTIRKQCGKWYACFSCKVESSPLTVNEKSVGIDLGIENFATLSDGQVISNPRFFKKTEKSLATAQRKLAKCKKASPERKKAKKVVSRIHQKVNNKRSDFLHKTSRKIINEYQYICVEDLSISKMMQDSYLAKSISCVSWGQFTLFLTYKAEDAGRSLGLVNPAYTSQDCSKCGHRKVKLLSERTHHCMVCGHREHRDINAAKNILAIGLDGLAEMPRSLHLQVGE